MLQGRKKAVWISISSDLRVDAKRDLTDIGANEIAVHDWIRFDGKEGIYLKGQNKKNEVVKKEVEGVMFGTYSLLTSKWEALKEGERKTKRGKQLETPQPSASEPLKKEFNSRLEQLLDWCGENFDGVIIFDECHKAKNLVQAGSAESTQTGIMVVELQQRLPKARVVYSSATGASEARHFGYMVRLGLWGKDSSFPGK